MNPLRIAVIGAGVFGRKHVESVRAEPRGELAAISDPAPEAAPYAAELSVVCYLLAGTEGSLAMPKPRAVAIPGSRGLARAAVARDDPRRPR